jgi:hypothetical protein
LRFKPVKPFTGRETVLATLSEPIGMIYFGAGVTDLRYAITDSASSELMRN